MLTTIGYEKSSLEDFISTLSRLQIELLVDIRDRAQSRRKGFSKTALSQALAEAGIQYLHLKNLGDPKEGREAARAGDYAKFKKIFAEVMASQPALDALELLKASMEAQKVCLMCYERDPVTCHRKIVADKLVDDTGIEVMHVGVRHGEARKAA